MARMRTATADVQPSRPLLVRLTSAGQVSIPKPLREAQGHTGGDFFAIQPLPSGGYTLEPQTIAPDPDRQAYLNAKAGVGLSPVFNTAAGLLADLHKKTGRKPAAVVRSKRKK